MKAGGNFRRKDCKFTCAEDGTPSMWEVHGAGFAYKGKPHILGVVRDVTEQVRAYELLEQRVEERTRELSTLLEVSTNNVVSTLQLQPLLRRPRPAQGRRRLSRLLGARTDRGPAGDAQFAGHRHPRECDGAKGHSPLELMGPIWEVVQRGEQVIMDDVRGDTPLAAAFREAAGRPA